MSLNVALQMDPVESINPKSDNTMLLSIEAQKRGYKVFYYLPQDLSFEDGKVKAQAYPVTFHKDPSHYYAREEPRIIDLASDIDVVLMRQNPPFDMAYITATFILDHIKEKTLIVNDPTEVRNAPEKLLTTHFPDLIPPTLISRNKQAILDFYQKHKNIVLKPLYSFGGDQVYHVDRTGKNLITLLEMYAKFFQEPIVIQKYIPDVVKGDKRVILLDGNPIGACLKIPPKNEIRSGLDLGGKSEKTSLSARDIEICNAIGPVLKDRNLIFASIDILGEYLSEINVTSPGGIPYINKLDNVCLEEKFWDAFEEKLRDRGSFVINNS
ncbi:MAG: glutathione synthase [Alphaproteobacteria bacterium]